MEEASSPSSATASALADTTTVVGEAEAAGSVASTAVSSAAAADAVSDVPPPPGPGPGPGALAVSSVVEPQNSPPVVGESKMNSTTTLLVSSHDDDDNDNNDQHDHHDNNTKKRNSSGNRILTIQDDPVVASGGRGNGSNSQSLHASAIAYAQARTPKHANHRMAEDESDSAVDVVQQQQQQRTGSGKSGGSISGSDNPHMNPGSNPQATTSAYSHSNGNRSAFKGYPHPSARPGPGMMPMHVSPGGSGGGDGGEGPMNRYNHHPGFGPDSYSPYYHHPPPLLSLSPSSRGGSGGMGYGQFMPPYDYEGYGIANHGSGGVNTGPTSHSYNRSGGPPHFPPPSFHHSYGHHSDPQHQHKQHSRQYPNHQHQLLSSGYDGTDLGHGSSSNWKSFNRQPPHHYSGPSVPNGPSFPQRQPSHDNMAIQPSESSGNFSRTVSSSFDRSIKSQSHHQHPQRPMHHMSSNLAYNPQHHRPIHLNANPEQLLQDQSSQSHSKVRYLSNSHLPSSSATSMVVGAPPSITRDMNNNEVDDDDASWGQLNQVASVDEEEIRKRLARHKRSRSAADMIMPTTRTTTPDQQLQSRHPPLPSSNSSSLTNSPNTEEQLHQQQQQQKPPSHVSVSTISKTQPGVPPSSSLGLGLPHSACSTEEANGASKNTNNSHHHRLQSGSLDSLSSVASVQAPMLESTHHSQQQQQHRLKGDVEDVAAAAAAAIDDDAVSDSASLDLIKCSSGSSALLMSSRHEMGDVDGEDEDDDNEDQKKEGGEANDAPVSKSKSRLPRNNTVTAHEDQTNNNHLIPVNRSNETRGDQKVTGTMMDVSEHSKTPSLDDYHHHHHSDHPEHPNDPYRHKKLKRGSSNRHQKNNTISDIGGVSSKKASPLSIECSPPTSPPQHTSSNKNGNGHQKQHQQLQPPIHQHHPSLEAPPTIDSYYDKPPQFSYSMDSAPPLPRHNDPMMQHPVRAVLERPESTSSTITPMNIEGGSDDGVGPPPIPMPPGTEFHHHSSSMVQSSYNSSQGMHPPSFYPSSHHESMASVNGRPIIGQASSWEIHHQDSFGNGGPLGHNRHSSINGNLLSCFSFNTDYPLLNGSHSADGGDVRRGHLGTVGGGTGNGGNGHLPSSRMHHHMQIQQQNADPMQHTMESRNPSFENNGVSHYRANSFSRNETMIGYDHQHIQGGGLIERNQGYHESFPPHSPSWGSSSSFPPGHYYSNNADPSFSRNYSDESGGRTSPTSAGLQQSRGGGGMHPHSQHHPTSYANHFSPHHAAHHSGGGSGSGSFQPPPDFRVPPSMVPKQGGNGAQQQLLISASPYSAAGGKGVAGAGSYGWSKDEDNRLTDVMKKYKSPRDWEPIAKEHNCGRSAKECHERWIRYLKPGVRKGQWTDHEDAIVMDVVTSSSEQPFTRWSDLAQRLPGRVGKQIRDRWVNHLNPNINHLPFSREDDLALWEGHKVLGKKWVEISTKFFENGRSENHIKNRWYSASFKKFISNEFGLEAYNGGKGSKHKEDGEGEEEIPSSQPNSPNKKKKSMSPRGTASNNIARTSPTKNHHQELQQLRIPPPVDDDEDDMLSHHHQCHEV